MDTENRLIVAGVGGGKAWSFVLDMLSLRFLLDNQVDTLSVQLFIIVWSFEQRR